MKKFFSLLMFCLSVKAFGQVTDSLFLSQLYTTHVLFSTEVTYVDISNPKVVVAKIVEQNKNILAIKARGEFDESCSVTVLQSNGTINTFIARYMGTPQDLVVDKRRLAEKGSQVSGGTENVRTAVPLTEEDGEKIVGAGGTIAPTLESVMKESRQVFHIGDRQYGIAVYCYNVFVYNDITYLVLNMENSSNISYRTGEPEFAVENRMRGRRQIQYTNKIVPRSHFGTLCAEPEGNGMVVYCFDKITLNKDQVFKAYIYEDGGQRNLTLMFNAKDFNNARRIE